MWLSNSSIGRKVVMSVTGIALVLFLTFHMAMNLVALFSGEAYNMVCEFLGANWYALVATVGLAALFVIHIIYAFWLTMQNRASGKVHLGDYQHIGYFEQESDTQNTSTCIEEIWSEFPAMTQYEIRSMLAKCGLTTKHIESQVRVLSGGEQAKVRLCKILNRESNILLLDEPTNHLDVDAKAELKKALQEYKGSILLICHEPEFYQDIVTTVWNCQEWSLKL